MNSIHFDGNLVYDPEVTFDHEQRAKLRMKIASNHRYSRNGQQLEERVVLPVICWGSLAERCESLQKGDWVHVIGRLKELRFDDRSVLEVHARSVWRGL